MNLSCVQDLPTNQPQPVLGPTVKILTPADNASILDSTVINVDATSEKGVARVEIYVDYRTDSNRTFTTKPYRWKWDTRVLADSSLHKIYAVAYDNNGNRGNSSVVNVTTLIQASSLPPAPSGLDIVSMNSGGVTLRWQDNSDFETGFDIMLSADDGRNYTTVATVGADTIENTLSGNFDQSDIYLFRVRARAGVNVSGFSNGVKAQNIKELYAGGSFTSAGGIPANNLARWNGKVWSAVGSGTNSSVYALAVYNEKSTISFPLSYGKLYAGGLFTSAGGIPANRVATWDGRVWNSVGTGMNRTVYTFATVPVIEKSLLFAGGTFTTAGGVQTNSVAFWNGEMWSPWGSGMSDVEPAAVYSLKVLGGVLYAGGRFSLAGGIPVGNIARSSGVGWTNVGEGMNAPVLALGVYSNRVLAGGEFDSADGQQVNHLAQWDGTNWLQVGSGTNGTVYALQTVGGALHVAGQFTTVGGISASNIGRLTDSVWTNLAGGTNGPVFVIFDYMGGMYVGGDFTSAGSTSANSIARWDGVTWSAVGGGVNGVVRALANYSYWKWVIVP